MAESSDLIFQIEQELMENIAKRLEMTGDTEEPNYITQWQQMKLRQVQELRADNVKVINRLAGQQLKATDGDITEAGANAVEAIEPQFLSAIAQGVVLNPVLPYDEDTTLKAIVQSYVNIGQTNARLIINDANAAALQVYSQSINKTVLKVNLGIATPQVALRQTIREWSKTGLPVLTDAAGRTWTAESYYNNVLRSTVRNVTTDIQFKRMDQYGTDLIEISSHADARPGCEPYQGRIYSRSGTDNKYPSFSDTTYGEASGIFGNNCRHEPYPFFEGISTHTFTRPDTEENNKNYELSQVQRRLERSIRQAKREEAVYKANGDDVAAKKAKDLVKARQARLRGFLDETGRTRRSNRELIYAV